MSETTRSKEPSQKDIGLSVNCDHRVSQGREGEKGSWCTVCGEKVFNVDDRNCGTCRHYQKDTLSFSGKTGVCKRHLMRVTEDMNVTYKIETGTCWSGDDA